MSAQRRKRRRSPTRGRGSKEDPRRPSGAAWRGFLSRPSAPAMLVFLAALAIRILYLVQMSDSPSFLMPLVDSEVYDRAAWGLANGRGFDQGFFYQPFWYPFFLGVLYTFAGHSIVAVKAVQAVIGAATCALACGLGGRLYGRRAGVVAGAVTAVYGPLVFFDGELLATGWAALWSVLLVWLFVEAAERDSMPLLAGLGVGCGLAVITRPTFLPFVLAAAGWLLWKIARRDRHRLVRSALSTWVGFAVVVVPVAMLCLETTDRFRFLPASGGLNLHIGNNAERCDTLTTRPGQEWRDLISQRGEVQPDRLWETDRYFRDLFGDYVAAHPWGFISGLGAKALHFVSSREIPRNLDIYLFRRWSSVLRLTVWEVGGFGFPFGLLLPLAAIGIVVGWRQLPPPVLLYLVLYPVAVIAVFVSARYRVPVVPVMAVVAAGGLMWIADAVAARRGKPLAVAASVAAIVLVVAVVPGPFCQEKDLESEYWFLMAAAELRADRRDRAVDNLRRAVELEPGYFEASYQLGTMLLERGEVAESAEHLRRAVNERPGFGPGHRELGTALGRLGRFDEARQHLESALTILPDDVRVLNSLGALSAREGDLLTARALLERATAIDPEHQASRANLEYVLRQLEGDPSPGGQP